MAKRRANGEGSIRKRKDGRWEGRYTAGRDPVTGKVIYKNVLGKTQAEVKEKLKSAIVTGSDHQTLHSRSVAGRLDGELRQAPSPAIIPQNLPGLHRKPHQARPRGHSSGKAGGDGPPTVVQTPAGERQGGVYGSQE